MRHLSQCSIVLAGLLFGVPAFAQGVDFDAAPGTPTQGSGLTVISGGGAPDNTCNSLTTLFVSNNGGSLGGQVFFDMNVTKAGGLTIYSFDINVGEAVGTPIGMNVFTIPGTYVGNHNNMAAWTNVASGSGFSAGVNNPSRVNTFNFSLAPGTYGVSLVLSATVGHDYTNGTGANQFFSNADLALTLGAALNVPWTGTPFTPRVWNGRVYYDCSRPAAYCTAKVSSCGTAPTITGPGPATSQGASGPGSYDISFGPVPGGPSPAIAIYTTNGPVANPVANAFGFLCINGTGMFRVPPAILASGAACSATYAVDFGNFLATQSADPALLPSNLPAIVDLQGWYRDPADPGFANLTNAITFQVDP